MRTLVDIPDAQVQELDDLAKRQRQSRSALIREAVADFLEKRRSEPADDAFGLWGKVDGLAYQRRVRRGW